MKKHNNYNSRNMGYGKMLSYASKQALNDRYGEGKFATKASHAARFNQFANWCKSQGVNDARNITGEHIAAYASELSDLVRLDQKSVSYAQNQLSSVNVVLSTMRGDNTLKVSPSALVGERNHVRQSCPLSLDRNRYEMALSRLASDDAKLALTLSREFGLRLREVGLFRPKEAITQLIKTGTFNVQRGVKGGRNADRLIKPTQSQIRLLSKAQQFLGNKCLVDNVGKYTEWKNQFYREYEKSGARELLGKFHDNRTAFACEKYHELTGKPAPVLAGRRMVSKAIDKAAREQISKFLGHNRVDVVAQYIGSAK